MTEARKRIVLTVLLVAECVCAAYAVARQLPFLIDQSWVQDDAYVSFRYARNLVLGRGLVYNEGAYVEGYTNFLWTLISAIPLAAGAEDPLFFMHVVGGILWAGSYLILLRLGVIAFGERLWIGPLALVPLSYHWSYNLWFFSGMETPLVCFLTLAAVYFFSRDPGRHPSTLLWAALSGVALMLTRPDGAVVVAALAAAGVLCYGRRLWSGRDWRTYLWRPLLPILFVYLPFTGWRVWYYGDFYPNTYYAKVAYLPFWDRGWEYLRAYLLIYGVAPWVALLPLGALAARPGVTRRFLLAASVVTAAVVLYVVRLGGDFMEWRFLTPISGLVYPGIVLGAAAVVRRLAGWLRRRQAAEEPRGNLAGWIGGLALAAILVVITRAAPANMIQWYPGGIETIGLLRRYCDPGRYDWRVAGKVFNEVLPPNVKIATTSAGAIPFFCDRHCLDLHGLTDPQIAREPVTEANRGRVGHEHWLNEHDKIRARGIDVVLEWGDPSIYPNAVLHPPTDKGELVSVKLPDGRFIDMTILNPAAFDRAALAKDDRVVLYGSMAIADRHKMQAVPEKLRGLRLVDSIDLEDETSERAHDFREMLTDGVHRGSWHRKVIQYEHPYESVRLEDHGRRYPIGASWKVLGVEADKPLYFVARYDHTQGSAYDVEINGKRLEEPLRAPGGAEAWGETWVEIPSFFLVAGTNQMRFLRRADQPGDMEWYYFWFLQ